VLATVKLIMRRIIEQLKEQREKAKDTFIENSFIKRNCKIDAPCPDTDADLDAISELNQVISILENATMAKTQPVNSG
jgi:tRNA splicing ligase